MYEFLEELQRKYFGDDGVLLYELHGDWLQLQAALAKDDREAIQEAMENLDLDFSGLKRGYYINKPTKAAA